ncbi:hypothetical protein ON010_g2134 [Phytophthora cinnamomi]|nr:hypothetical protein ON010_g2134 [Phytophthora cinnamomi]
MRLSFLVVITALLASSGFAASATSDVHPTKIKASKPALANIEPSVRSLSARDNNGQRSLRVRVSDAEALEDPEDSEERVGGTGIAMRAHGLSDTDAKMVRQIAKGRSPSHTLDKFKVPYEVRNGERVYSKYNELYAKYVDWLKRYNDHPLTFPKRG